MSTTAASCGPVIKLKLRVGSEHYRMRTSDVFAAWKWLQSHSLPTSPAGEGPMLFQEDVTGLVIANELDLAKLFEQVKADQVIHLTASLPRSVSFRLAQDVQGYQPSSRDFFTANSTKFEPSAPPVVFALKSSSEIVRLQKDSTPCFRLAKDEDVSNALRWYPNSTVT